MLTHSEVPSGNTVEFLWNRTNQSCCKICSLLKNINSYLEYGTEVCRIQLYTDWRVEKRGLLLLELLHLLFSFIRVWCDLSPGKSIALSPCISLPSVKPSAWKWYTSPKWGPIEYSHCVKIGWPSAIVVMMEHFHFLFSNFSLLLGSLWNRITPKNI